jgi:hypothetical protein
MKHLLLVLALCVSLTSAADTFFFSTGNPDGRMAVGSRPSSTGKIEIEAADDFVLASSTTITSATFTGLLTGGATLANVGNVGVEIYRVFPNDSNTTRTPNVPTRVNSPSDVAFDTRDSTSGLAFSGAQIGPFTANNSVLNGINPSPNQTTGGEGSVTGTEVVFTVTFTTPFTLGADHYFFIPQVQVAGGEFYWLSAPRPIVSPGTPFSPDLQMWVRNENLDPDWLRVGTDIVGGTTPPTFNAAFTLSGEAAATAVPEPASILLLATGVAGFLGRRKRISR